MISLLIRIFIPDYQNITEPKVRQQYGLLCGIVGICFNTLLFSCKLAAGLLSHSIAITADAINNLSDAASSVITLLGFRIAGQKADSDHPYGHGRSEYIAGLIVAISILFMAVELLHSSISKIFHPEEVLFSPVIFCILIISIFVKFYMYLYNRNMSKRISSTTLHAAAADSISDAFSTFAVLVTAVISYTCRIHIDGWCGVFVGIIIFINGINTIKDTINPLLGQAPDEAFTQKIRDLVSLYPEVLDIHDLVVHDYGPGRRMISLHAEVPAKGDILALHDTIDNIEKRLQSELYCSAVIHMDPVMNDDAETMSCKAIAESILLEIDPKLTLHDFRIVKGPTHTNLIFDVVVPFGASYTTDALKETVAKKLTEKNASFYSVIEIDYK